MITTDNLRKFRRDLAGRGVNIREALCVGAAADTDILVATLKDGDEIISVIDMTTLVEKALRMSRVAFTTFYATNKLFRITMNRPNLAADGSKMYFKIVPAAVDDETSVVLGAHPTVEGAHLVTVNAHVSSGTTIDLTAAELVQAVNISEAGKVVTASLSSGTGADAVTATDSGAGGDLIGADASTASTAAQTGFVLSQGPLAAAYDTDPDQTAEAAVVFTARIPGAGGNALDIQYVDDVLNPTVPYVTVASGVVKVHIDTGVTLASAVVSAVNAAVVPVTAELKSGNDGSGVVVTMAAQSLADGRDEGRIRLTATTVSGVTADVVRVAWVGRA